MLNTNHPIIVLGAARSGTKLLRDTLGVARDLGMVEYDVNYVWRAGNERFPHDALPQDLATEKNRRFVRKHLRRIAVGKPKSGRFIEKTVGNVLRIPFVHQVYPDAQYVFLIRDGRDVAESATRCWQEPAKLNYLVKKLKTFPWRRGARYAADYAQRFALRSLGITTHLSSWGPRYPAIDEDVQRLPLWQVCARQWLASIEAYEHTKHVLAPEQIVEVRYEDLVADPAATFGNLCQKLAIEDERSVIDRARKTIVRGNVGKQSRLDPEQQFVISELQSGVLERWGYGGNSSVRPNPGQSHIAA